MAYMTEERSIELENRNVHRLSDVKKTLARLNKQQKEWSALFKSAARELEVGLPGRTEGFDFSTLPGPRDVAEAWKEYGELLAELAEIQEFFRQSGLQIE